MSQDISQGNKFIVEGNLLIANFMMPMGNPLLDIREAKYHSSWDWLMPVVESIEATHMDFHGYFGVHISSNGCTIAGTRLNTGFENPHYAYFNDVVHESKLSATWNAIVQFIQWYNSQTPKEVNK